MRLLAFFFMYMYVYVCEGIWDGLLEGRIRLQKVLPLINRLPQGEMMDVFKDHGKDAITDRLKHSESL